MKKAIWLIFILQIGILASCAPETSTTPVLETSTPAATASRTPAPTPSITPTASLTPSLTPPAIIDEVIDFPDWVSDPEVDVALVKLYGPFSLINANTGEFFDLPIEEASRVFWLSGGEKLGFVFKEDPEKMHVLNITDGLTNIVPYASHVGIRVFAESVDGNYFLFKDIQVDPAPFKILDVNTNEIIYVEGQHSPLNDIERYWSPVAPHLMILRAEFYQGLDRGPCDCKLVVFDADTRREIAVFEGSFSDVRWSPDGTQILYIRPLDTRIRYDGELCILTLASGTSQCYQDGRESQGGVGLLEPEWSPDGSRISYIYWTDNTNEAADNFGGFCFIELASEEIICPINLLPTGTVPEYFVNRWVQSYRWSPSGENIFIRYGCPACDYSSGLIDIDVIVAADSSHYYPLAIKDGIAWYPIVYRFIQWRPKMLGLSRIWGLNLIQEMRANAVSTNTMTPSERFR